MRPDTPHPSREDLAAFDAGVLPPADREAVERHVAGCAACCRTLEQLPENPLAARIRVLAADSTADGTGATPTGDPPPMPPELIDHPRVKLLGLIGAGGMGAVYRAVQRPLDRVVAVKVLHRRLTDRPGFADRFRHEVRALARLNHPNVVAAYDADRAGETHFLVMELVAGDSLDAVVRRRGPLAPADACSAAHQAALALQHAHEHGIVHRDVKPGNLLLAPDGVVKVADFGLARLVGDRPPGPPGSAPDVVGTPEYMAPEQARAPDRADTRSDLYSLGCTLHYLLTGRPPFSAASPLQTLLAHQDVPPPPLPGIPPAVALTLARLLAKDPTDRFATPAEAAAALARATAPAPGPGRPRRWRWVGAAVLVSAAGTAAALTFIPGDRTASPGPPAQEPGPISPPALPPTEPAIAIAPPPRAVERPRPAALEHTAALRRRAADQMAAWVRENNVWKPDAEIAVKTAQLIETSLPKASGFAARLGGGTLKTGKPTLLAASAGGFFVFELTPEQARGANLGERSFVFREQRFATEERRPIPELVLSDFRIDAAADHPVGGRLVGAVACRFPTPPGPNGHLRVTYHQVEGGRRVTFMHYPKPTPPAGPVVLRFSADPIDPNSLKGERLVAVFAEWATRNGTEDVIVSNTTAALVLFRDGRARAP